MTANKPPSSVVIYPSYSSSLGPRTRRAKSKDKKAKDPKAASDEKRPRTAFTSEQLEKLRQEFQANSYLDERRRKDLAERLCLGENQIKIWFQNKRAKMKKQNNQPTPLRKMLISGGLYNHSTATSDCSESYANGNDRDDDDDDDDLVSRTDDQSELLRTADGQQVSNHHSSNKRRRDISDDGNLNFNNLEGDTGMGSAKRLRAGSSAHSGSDSCSNSSRIGVDLDDEEDEDERVISVS